VRSAIIAKHSLWEVRKLDVKKMQTAAQLLLGKHDFSAFRGSLCQAKSPIKTIEFIELSQSGDDILIDIKANAFLHHMVRNIVGTLLKIGRGERPIEWMQAVLDSQQRKKAGATAQPQGLYFVKAFY
jgi:tRNA pseudouridine38-40 synthase